MWRNTGTGGVYVAVPATVTLHRIAACDECANQTANLCQVRTSFPTLSSLLRAALLPLLLLLRAALRIGCGLLRSLCCSESWRTNVVVWCVAWWLQVASGFRRPPRA